MWCVVNGIIGGCILCVVGNSMGLGQVDRATYDGALPRYEVIAHDNGCDLVRNIDIEGVATHTIVCNN